MTTLALFGMRHTLLNANYYKSALKQSGIYNEVLENGGSLIYEKISENNNIMGEIFSAKDISKIISSSISAQWLEEQTNKLIDEAVDYSLGKTQEFKFEIPLDQIKNTMLEGFISVFRDKFNTLPICTQSQIEAFELTGLSEVVNCKPIGQSFAEIENSIRNNDSLKVIPDNFNIGDYITQSPLIFSNIRNAVSTINIVFWSTAVVSFLLFLFIVLLNLTNISGLLKWTSIPLLIVSILFFIVVSIAKLMMSFNLNSFMTVGPEITFDWNTLFTTLINKIYFYDLILSASIFAFALILLIIGIILGRKKS